MKKTLVSAASMLLICGGLFAQPKPQADPENMAEQGIRRNTPSSVPVAPATILLLSLAGGFVGGKICKNAFSSKNKQ